MIKNNIISSKGFYSEVFNGIKNKRKGKIAFRALFIILLIGLFAPFIANNQPYYIRVFNHTYFPLFSTQNQIILYDNNGISKTIDAAQVDWKHLPFESAIFPPIAYSPTTSDLLNANYIGPDEDQYFENQDNKTNIISFKFKHYLGTNKRGEDVASCLIHGASTSLLVGLLSMLIAGTIGIALGLLAGYFGNDNVQLKQRSIAFLIIGIILAFFYSIQLRWYNLVDALSNTSGSFIKELILSFILFGAIIFVVYFLAEKLFSKTKYLSNIVYLPLDSMIAKIIEVLISLPVIILIISISAISKPSFFNLIFIIGLIQWTSIARIVRAEMLKIKHAEFMQAAKILGVKPFQTLIYHALPNVISPAIVSITFGVAQAILIESSLSFLGLGLPVNTVSWGALISSGCENFNAWWLVIFPGIFIFITVICFNILGETLRESIDVRFKK